MTGSSVTIRPLRLLLTGGGTGGHLFPAVATAENLQSRVDGSEILFVGTKRKLDSEHLQRLGFSVKSIHSYGLKGKKLGQLLKALAVLPVSFCEACFHLLRFRPHVVFGVGGYVTGPVIAAAWLLRRPTVIHEQNSVPGMANRKLGRLADKICISLPESSRFFPPGKTVLTGNPVRSGIIEIAAQGKKNGRRTLLVLGGSQGAHAINKLMIDVFCDKDRDFGEIEVIHQTGKTDQDWVLDSYKKAGVKAKVSDFFTDMAAVYSQADLIVSRAGATTLAEIAVLGTPAVLIPFPFAADNHQEKNAAWYAESGGAKMFIEKELTADLLAAELKTILTDTGRLEEMSGAMTKLGIPDAARQIVDICLALARP